MELKINNNTYKIYFVDKNNEKLLMEDEEYHSGTTYFKEKEIYIDKTLNCDSLRYTIIHELTHAYLDSYGFLQVYFNDEIIADLFGNYLINILYDYNKIMTEFEKISQKSTKYCKKGE